MKRSRTAVFVAFSLLVAAAGGCGGSTAPGDTFQITGIVHGLLLVDCGGGHPAPDTLLFNVHVVNTQSSDVTVTRVQSVGSIIRSSPNNIGVGASVNMFDELPFVPDPTVVPGTVGDRSMTVSLPTGQLCAPNASHLALDYRDGTVSFRVYSSAGLDASAPLTIHVLNIGGTGIIVPGGN